MSKVYADYLGTQNRLSETTVSSIITAVNTTIPQQASQISSLTTRMANEEQKTQPVSLGGTGATTAQAARANLAVVGTATNAVPFGAFNSSNSATSLSTSVTLTPAVPSRALVMSTFVGNGTLSDARISTTQGTVATSQFNFSTSGSGFGVINLSSLTSTTITLNLSQNTSAGIFAGIVVILLPYS